MIHNSHLQHNVLLTKLKGLHSIYTRSENLFAATLCPLVEDQDISFLLDWQQGSRMLLSAPTNPSYYIMNFDKPISQPSSQEENAFLTWWLHNEE